MESPAGSKHGIPRSVPRDRKLGEAIGTARLSHSYSHLPVRETEASSPGSREDGSLVPGMDAIGYVHPCPSVREWNQNSIYRKKFVKRFIEEAGDEDGQGSVDDGR